MGRANTIAIHVGGIIASITAPARISFDGFFATSEPIAITPKDATGATVTGGSADPFASPIAVGITPTPAAAFTVATSGDIASCAALTLCTSAGKAVFSYDGSLTGGQYGDVAFSVGGTRLADVLLSPIFVDCGTAPGPGFTCANGSTGQDTSLTITDPTMQITMLVNEQPPGVEPYSASTAACPPNSVTALREPPPSPGTGLESFLIQGGPGNFSACNIAFSDTLGGSANLVVSEQLPPGTQTFYASYLGVSSNPGIDAFTVHGATELGTFTASAAGRNYVGIAHNGPPTSGTVYVANTNNTIDAYTINPTSFTGPTTLTGTSGLSFVGGLAYGNNKLYAVASQTTVTEYTISGTAATLVATLSPTGASLLDDIAIDPSGNVYITDYSGGKLFVYPASGSPFSHALSDCPLPTGVGWGNGQLYILCTGTPSVNAYTVSGTTITRVATTGNANTVCACTPTGVAVGGASSNVYVTSNQQVDAWSGDLSTHLGNFAVSKHNLQQATF
ncbi:MAG: hypothetical protein JO152_00065 [Mycobacteriaceae bacterium]|nr:hypothetical protein [Mycobacteriaceae bacterium]